MIAKYFDSKTNKTPESLRKEALRILEVEALSYFDSKIASLNINANCDLDTAIVREAIASCQVLLNHLLSSYFDSKVVKYQNIIF